MSQLYPAVAWSPPANPTQCNIMCVVPKHTYMYHGGSVSVCDARVWRVTRWPACCVGLFFVALGLELGCTRGAALGVGVLKVSCMCMHIHAQACVYKYHTGAASQKASRACLRSSSACVLSVLCSDYMMTSAVPIHVCVRAMLKK